eukprot:TRINITY_DN20337_c0_g1_i1.p1 TRINITY_DN20337_c0_g1~~TRINITY_DN20337_c0_g1_i1.p1  ORF type:complete len:251 (-),score=45.39 TRINITY_DN20337_c0_g1_i1:321-1073(-)
MTATAAAAAAQGPLVFASQPFGARSSSKQAPSLRLRSPISSPSCNLRFCSTARQTDASLPHNCSSSRGFGGRGGEFLRLKNSRTQRAAAGGETLEVVGKEKRPRPRQNLSGQDLVDWEECVGEVVGLGFEAAEAEKMLERAYGWSSQAFWMDDRVNEVARPDDLRERIRYLESLGLNREDLAKAAKEFPEILGLDVEGRITVNVKELADKWYIDGPSLKGVILRRPQALGLSVDCGGDCIAECNRCWARF